MYNNIFNIHFINAYQLDKTNYFDYKEFENPVENLFTESRILSSYDSYRKASSNPSLPQM